MKPGVVPSVFLWVGTSPQKRKAPTERDFDASASRSAVRNLDVPGLVVSEVAASEVSSIVSDVESNIAQKWQDFRTAPYIYYAYSSLFKENSSRNNNMHM